MALWWKKKRYQSFNAKCYQTFLEAIVNHKSSPFLCINYTKFLELFKSHMIDKEAKEDNEIDVDRYIFQL